MAYQTGVATSPTQLRDAVQSFAAGLGWTINRADDNGNPRLFLSEADQFVQLRFTVNEVEYAGGRGFSSGADWSDQAGYCGWDGDTNGVNYPVIYHLFGGSGYVHCALEVETGLFTHFCFGRIAKFGSFTGGHYVVGIYWNPSATYVDVANSNRHSVLWDNLAAYGSSAAGMLYAEMPENTNHWGIFTAFANGIGSAGWSAEGSGRTGWLNFPLHGYGPNSFNALQPLYPITISGSRDNDDLFYSPLGAVVDARYINMEDYGPGAEIIIGGDTWKVFPLRQKNGPINQPNSGNYGIAYLKTP